MSGEFQHTPACSDGSKVWRHKGSLAIRVARPRAGYATRDGLGNFSETRSSGGSRDYLALLSCGMRCVRSDFTLSDFPRRQSGPVILNIFNIYKRKILLCLHVCVCACMGWVDRGKLSMHSKLSHGTERSEPIRRQAD